MIMMSLEWRETNLEIRDGGGDLLAKDRWP